MYPYEHIVHIRVVNISVAQYGVINIIVRLFYIKSYISSWMLTISAFFFVSRTNP
jgi:hypothetical protein